METTTATEGTVTGAKMTGDETEIVIERGSDLEILTLSADEAKALMIVLARLA